MSDNTPAVWLNMVQLGHFCYFNEIRGGLNTLFSYNTFTEMDQMALVLLVSF